jgi:uncharacterized small protein (DUF1192 family)
MGRLPQRDDVAIMLQQAERDDPEEGWPMSVFGDDDRPRPARVHEIGQDLAPLSLEELDRRIEMLKAEIARLVEARAGKQASKAAADLFFKR